MDDFSLFEGHTKIREELLPDTEGTIGENNLFYENSIVHESTTPFFSNIPEVTISNYSPDETILSEEAASQKYNTPLESSSCSNEGDIGFVNLLNMFKHVMVIPLGFRVALKLEGFVNVR